MTVVSSSTTKPTFVALPKIGVEAIAIVIQVVSVMLLTMCIVKEPEFAHSISKLIRGFGDDASRISSHPMLETLHRNVGFERALIGGAIVFLGAGALPLVAKRRANLRFVLCQCLLLAICFAIIGQRSAIAWYGAQYRSGYYASELNDLAKQIDWKWPSQDGEISSIGPFTSYPVDRPTVLLLLSPYPLAGTQTVVAAIERPSSGTLLFQLGGRDLGLWLHWDRSGAPPNPHVSGLGEQRNIAKARKIGPQWQLIKIE